MRLSTQFYSRARIQSRSFLPGKLLQSPRPVISGRLLRTTARPVLLRRWPVRSGRRPLRSRPVLLLWPVLLRRIRPIRRPRLGLVPGPTRPHRLNGRAAVIWRPEPVGRTIVRWRLQPRPIHRPVIPRTGCNQDVPDDLQAPAAGNSAADSPSFLRIQAGCATPPGAADR
jgi:hypothetical protein